MQQETQTRPHELEDALRSFETPKARLPYKLVTRAAEEDDNIGALGHSDDADEKGTDGVVSRKDVKLQTQKTLRIEAKRAAAAAKAKLQPIAA